MIFDFLLCYEIIVNCSWILYGFVWVIHLLIYFIRVGRIGLGLGIILWWWACCRRLRFRVLVIIRFRTGISLSLGAILRLFVLCLIRCLKNVCLRCSLSTSSLLLLLPLPSRHHHSLSTTTPTHCNTSISAHMLSYQHQHPSIVASFSSAVQFILYFSSAFLTTAKDP